MPARYSQKSGGSGTKPRVLASGETVSHAPAATMITEVRMSGQLAQLWREGILLVRMTWMISVWVKSDSTNQPVWNRAGLCQQLKIYSRSEERRVGKECR